MEASSVKEIFKRLRASYPHAETMLSFNTVFELLTAVVLSAQSTDEQVNRVTKEMFKIINTPEAIADCRAEDLEKLISGVGLYKNKAKNLIAMAKIIRDEYNNEVPDSYEELIKMPGVGSKTANVVLSVGFGLPGLGVDTHVHRVSNRLGLVMNKNARQTEAALKNMLPPEQWGESHHVLIYHGRQICKARKANCEECVLEDLCERNLDAVKY
ncbi:MAG: endonuclease III [Syntrophomonadaceae bacterium]|nr:endonuclease III [Syntrophomonadaceae bacterium]